MAIWNLSKISEKSDKELMDEISSLAEEIEAYKGKDIPLAEFRKILGKLESLSRKSNRLMARASLKQAENTSDNENNARLSKLSNFSTEISNRLLFFEHWFQSLSEEKAEKYINSAEEYRYHLGQIRKFRGYMLKEDEEKIINLKDLSGSEELSKLYDIITNRFLFTWNNSKISQEELLENIRSSKRENRVKAYDLLLERYEEEEPVLGELYISILNDWKNENITLRGFKKPAEPRHLDNDLPEKAVNTMLNTVRKNIGLFHRYFDIKKKQIGLKDRYDIYMPYKEDKRISYEKAREKVLSLYKNFDREFYEKAENIFEENVHSEIRKGKKSGAFCMDITTEDIPYVMLNHNDTTESLFTMAHEIGHGVHFLLASKNNEFQKHPALPLAETASIFSEMLLSDKIYKESDRESRKSVLMRQLDNQYATIIRQAYFTLFEMKAHEMEDPSIDKLNEEYYRNLKEQFGNLEVPEKFKHEWKYIPHIYHVPFYCYSYAFANLVVLALFDEYRKNENFIERYKKILSAGGSASPEEILSGFDIEDERFWQKGFDIIRQEIEELETLIK
ncbi:MAG: M3 family oligoendopeptidase [Nanobdellota archaeon]